MGRVIAFPERRVDGEIWEPWVDEHAIAAHFAVSTRTVRRWRLAGCPSRLIVGARRFRLPHVENWTTERNEP